jgi:hypothetical protein
VSVFAPRLEFIDQRQSRQLAEIAQDRARVRVNVFRDVFRRLVEYTFRRGLSNERQDAKVCWSEQWLDAGHLRNDLRLHLYLGPFLPTVLLSVFSESEGHCRQVFVAQALQDSAL